MSRRPPVFLGTAEVLSIHRRMIRDFGGDPALRNPGLLESAVAMPAATFGGKFLHPRPADMAAAVLFHLCKKHPFVDGNKRTALAAAEVFLVLNGARLAATNRDLERLTLGVADGSVSKADLVRQLRRTVRKA